MKILIVEDHVEIAEFLIQNLQDEGFETEHVSDGKQAVDHILSHTYDLVILDLLLPSLHGKDVLKAVRTQQNEVPVIVLSSINEVESKVNLLNIGADDYLVKPFSFVELHIRIRSVLRRAQHKKGENEIQFGDLKVFPEMRAAYCAGETLKLCLKEYDLLEYFMLHPNQVISRNTLIEKVWDYNISINSNTVDSHVSLLRKKIKKYSSNDPLKTVRGVGYMLTE